jgi:hypothetical protein
MGKENPVSRKLVDETGKWKWSSFRRLEQDCREGEPITIDDWDE